MTAKYRLKSELKNLRENPPDGIKADTVNNNLFLWEAVITGPAGSYFEGGEFIAEVEIPQNYPISPPKMKFNTDIFHPNVYTTGSVCISILHSPGEDPTSGESPRERWNPQQSIEKILLSVLVMLSEPNVYSPANPTAANLFIENKSEFAKQALICVQKSKEVAKLKKYREEKEAQDKIFAETLLADQKREKEKEIERKLEERHQKRDKEKEIERKLEEDKVNNCSIKRKNETEDNIENLGVKRKGLGELQPEPASDCGVPTVVLQFRVKDRTIPLERRFKKTEDVETIFNYLRSEGFEPLKLEIIFWPNKDLSKEEGSTTLEELKMGPKENIMIRNMV